MNITRKRNLMAAALSLVFAFGPALSAHAQGPPAAAPLPRERDDWTFTLAPYLWMSSVRADVEAGPLSADTAVCFSDLLKNLDMGAQLRFEGLRNERWGFFLDGTYMNLSSDARARIGPFRVRGVDIDAQFTQAWLDFGGIYRLGERGRSFDILFGGRYAHIGSEVSVGPFLDLDQSLDFFAPLLGGRWQYDLSEKWLLALQGDIGGFGVGDAADLFWGASAVLGYRINDRTMLGLGYRYYDIDYSTDRIDAEVQFHGPMIGVAFRF